ncbi:MAG: hypothetical protein RIR37_1262 [Verrucomicrobiota bacterium]
MDGNDLRVGGYRGEACGDRVLAFLAAIDAGDWLGEIFMIDLIPTIFWTDHDDRVNGAGLHECIDAATQDGDAIECPCELVLTEPAAAACGDDDRAAGFDFF